MNRWLYSRRRREAEKAWRTYREVANALGDMPVLFSAGFSMGVCAAQREEDFPSDATA